MAKFDINDIEPVLKAIVDEASEDFRYEAPDPGGSCVYVADGKPSCIVGHLAVRLGIPLPDEGSASNGQTVDCGSHFWPYFTGRALERLRVVQARQDRGRTWKDSIR